MNSKSYGSAALGLTAAPAAAAKMLDRKIDIRGKVRVVRHRWRKDPLGWRLTSTLLKEGTTRAAGKALVGMAADLDQLQQKGREHADEIRERAGKRGNQAEGSAAAAAAVVAAGKRKGCDAHIACSDPLAVELSSGTRSAPRPRVTARRKTAAEQHRAGVLETVQGDPVLMEQIREMLGGEALGAAAARDAAVALENTRATAASLKVLKQNNKSNIGRIAYNTVLAAVAGAGEHTCDPTDPCNPAHRCPPAEPLDTAVSLQARAASLGVRAPTFRAAHVRMHNSDHSIPPADALEEGRYCWAHRKTRSDATDPRVLDLARRFWHSDDISRASGDSGTKSMWRPSKKEGEEYHPRRQLMVAGDKVWVMFRKWPEYLGLKEELLKENSNFKDPGRTTFLSTRCGCLVDPKVSQCACQIHTQQYLYLNALEFLMGAVHMNCDCTCSWCDGNGCGKWFGMCKNLHNFSEGLACEKVDLVEEDSNGGFEFWGRKPACAAMKCPECGFGKPNGIPTDCKALEREADRMVGWIRFEDQTMEDGKVHKKQQLPQVGKLGDLSEDFMAHSKKYMEHHELAVDFVLG